MSKISFETRIRLIYLAEKDVFNKAKGVVGVLGALNAVNTLDMNGLMPDKGAKTIRRMGESAKSLSIRQRAIVAAYKKRDIGSWALKSTAKRGFKKFVQQISDFLAVDQPKKKYIMNIEELATLYHFPVITTKAPLIKKTGSKRGEPPFSLPTE